MDKIPLRLRTPPLIEAIVEARFGPADKSAAELLPGLLYAKFKNRGFTEPSVQPLQQVPREVRRANPDFAFMPLFRLSGESCAVAVGEQVLGLSASEPYQGWKDFRQTCVDVLKFAHECDLLGAIQRVSMKYVNLYAAKPPESVLNGRFAFTHFKTKADGLRLRFELDRAPFTSIVELMSGATVSRRGSATVGTLFTFDAILQNLDGAKFWGDPGPSLDEVHAEAKKLFFGCVAPELISKMGPEGQDDTITLDFDRHES